MSGFGVSTLQGAEPAQRRVDSKGKARRHERGGEESGQKS